MYLPVPFHDKMYSVPFNYFESSPSPCDFQNCQTFDFKLPNFDFIDVFIVEDKKHKMASMSLTRPPMYPFGTGQYPYPMLSPEMSQVAASWHSPSMYPSLSAATSASAAAAAAAAAAGFRSPYQPGGPGGPDFYSRFSPTGLIGPPPPPPHGHGGHHHGQGLSPQGSGGHGPGMGGHPAIVTPGPKQELGLGLGGQGDMNHRYRSQVDHKNNMNNDMKNNQDANNAADKKKPHIKKPLNAFMLYMKEMRAKVVAECTLKESAAINQILGRKWHSLTREEQAKYYEKARQERQLHMQLYPGWSARDNYGYGTKKKKRKKERVPVESGGNSMKKCRARYGLDQQSQWCKPCRRKKKCIRYMEAGGGGADGNQSDDNLGSCGSMGDAHTPPEEDDDHDHDHHHNNDPNDDTEDDSMEHRSMSSPGALSALSSLTSPGGGVVLPSPSTSVASPSVSVASPYVMQLQSPLTPHNHDGLSLPLPSPFEALKLLPPPSIAPNYHHRLQHHLNSLHHQTQQLPPHHPPTPTTTILNPSTPTSPFLTTTPPIPHLNHHPILPPQQHPQHIPVGTNPHDVNNPLSVNQLTGQCVVKAEPNELNGGAQAVVSANGTAGQQQRSIISVT